MTMTLQLPPTGLHLRKTADGLLKRCLSVIPAKDAAYYAARGKEDATTALSALCSCLQNYVDDDRCLDDPVVATTLKTPDRFHLRYDDETYLAAFCAACADVCDHDGKWTYQIRRHENGEDWEVYAHSGA